MLVLSRKRKQSILIGSDIEVFVTRINRSDVRIAVRAPQDVKVLRGELVRKQTGLDAS
jgi:carbon storage regulator